MLRTKSASAMSSTRSNSSRSNSCPTARTHSSCAGDVGVPQIAYVRMAQLYRGRGRTPLSAPARALAEEIALARHHELDATALPPHVDAAHAGGGDPGCLAEHELRR